MHIKSLDMHQKCFFMPMNNDFGLLMTYSCELHAAVSTSLMPHLDSIETDIDFISLNSSSCSQSI